MNVLSAVREDRVAAVGREIFDRARQAEPSVLDASWWDERVLEWAMHRERLKVQLFRFLPPQVRQDSINIRGRI